MHQSVYRLATKLAIPLFLVCVQAQAFKVQQIIVTPNQGGHPEWVEMIKSARKSVRLAMYNMSEPGVIAALKDAAQQKIVVQVLFDLNNSKKDSQAKMLAELQAAGVEVQASSVEFTISHEKALLIDGKRLLISTINLTRHADTTRGYGVVLTDKSVIKEFLDVFNQDWQNGKNNTKITPKLTTAALVWSPEVGAPKIIGLINSAKKSIVLEVENLSYEPILEALGSAQADRKVSVRVITPLCGFGDDPFFNIPALRKLELRGVDGRVMGSPSTYDQPFIHAKMITVDGKRTYLGSLNFSYNSMLSAREVGILVDDASAVSTIAGHFEKDWSQALEVPPDTSKVTCPKFN